jgi:uncharacterized protein YndB with AHSA1/START domain
VGTVRASAERVVAASPQEVYGLLADYADRRRRLLTDGVSDYAVERGGVGAGTVVSYRMQVSRRERRYRLEVTEPTPGEELLETDTTSTFSTTWRVSPADGGSRVAVDSRWQGAGGVGGFFERTFAPRGLGRVYEQMLDRLEREIAGGASPGT